jgi:RAB protein geranylgeranyltransferase component A
LFQTDKIREYNFDFNPKFLFGKSKSTDELSSSRASQYMEFISVKKIYLHENKKFLTIPCSKSEIFTSEDLELFDKQKLLNFIYAVMKLKTKEQDVNTTVDIKKDYEVENKIYQELKSNLTMNYNDFLEPRFSAFLQKIIKFVLANLDPNENSSLNLTVENLTNNIYRYLNSLQIYDANPFIYPLYGSSEFSQALSRMSSVLGSVYIVSDTLQIGLCKNNENLIEPQSPQFAINVYDSSIKKLI